MRKTYVLDTNVVLHDPLALYKFDDNTIVLPIYVIEEVDRFKKELSELGQNARHVARIIDALRASNGHTLQEGVPIGESGGVLRVEVLEDESTIKRAKPGEMDRAILETALKVQANEKGTRVVFVTMDTNLRIRGDALGLLVENYEGGRVELDELFTGVVSIDCDQPCVEALAKREPVPLADFGDLERVPHANAGVVLKNRLRPKHSALGRFDASSQSVVPLLVAKESAWRVRPRNIEQHFALDLLLNPAIHMVTLVGKAGTGKTLLAVAAGLQCVVEDGAYTRLRVSRPIFPMGRDIGFLPGTVEEKLNPWMQPIFDNLEFIFGNKRSPAMSYRNYQELLSSGIIQVEPLTYIRGRSLPQQYIIVDEAQNLTPQQVKTIVTRCGADTKIVFTGDPAQIDNPYVDSASNGLTVLAERFQGEAIAGHVSLTKGERSELAELATKLL